MADTSRTGGTEPGPAGDVGDDRWPDVGTWLRRAPVRVLVTAVVTGGMAYLLNVWVMAVKYEGFNAPSGSIAPGKGNLVAGAGFWAAAGTVGGMLVGFRVAAGGKRFWSSLRQLPKAVTRLVSRDGAAARTHGLWGAAAALAVSVIVPPSTGAMVGIGLVLAVPSLLGRKAAGLLQRLASVVRKGASPVRALTMRVGMTGGAFGLLAGYVLPGRLVKLVAAVVCGVIALVLSGRLRPGAAAALVAVAVVTAGLFAAPSRAAADDGGWVECGSSWKEWLRHCPGASKVLGRAFGGAIPAALLSPLGQFLGELGLRPEDFEGLDEGAGEGGDGDDQDDEEQEGVIHRLVATPRSCHACQSHSAHRCYRTAAAAAGDRAHAFCHCAIVRQTVDVETWKSYFPAGASMYDDRGG